MLVATVVALLLAADGNAYTEDTLVWDNPTAAELKECAEEADGLTRTFLIIKGTAADKGYRSAACQITTQ